MVGRMSLPDEWTDGSAPVKTQSSRFTGAASLRSSSLRKWGSDICIVVDSNLADTEHLSRREIGLAAFCRS